MNNGAIAAVFGVAVILSLTVSLISADTVFADGYTKTQVASQTNECGNYWFPVNIICSNFNSQIIGDENNVATATSQESENIDSGTPFP
jgi:hypothetical protein